MPVLQFFAGTNLPLSWAELRSLKFGDDKRLGNTILVNTKQDIKKIYSEYRFIGGSKRMGIVIAQVDLHKYADLEQSHVDVVRFLTHFLHHVFTQDVNNLTAVMSSAKTSLAGVNFLDKEGIQALRTILQTIYTKAVTSLNPKFFNLNILAGADVTKALPEVSNLGHDVLKNLKDAGLKLKMLGSMHQLEKNTATSKKVLRNKGLEVNVTYDLSTKKVVISVTIAVQDYDLWGRIEYKRPVRSMKVGMIPLKLAFIMLNLARIKEGKGFWDPMAGLGTIVMAGLLKGAYSYGSDVDHRMVEAMKKNIAWMYEQGLVSKPLHRVFLFDIRKRPKTNKMLANIIRTGRFDAIVTEGYLGPRRYKPFRSKKHAMFWAKRVAMLNKQFLKNITSAVRVGGRVVFCMPIFTYAKKDGFGKLEVEPEINKNRFKVVKFRTGELVWSRKGAVVARKIHVLERIK